MNVIESLLGLASRPEKPLHAGEVMSLWSVTLALAEGRIMIEVFIHHTADPELKQFMANYVTDFEIPWTARFRKFMLEKGIPLPARTPQKPDMVEGGIPAGGKFTDAEITHLMASKLVAGLQIIQQGTVQCLRVDLGTMLLELEAATYKQALLLREMAERRGWLQVPPYWNTAKPT